MLENQGSGDNEEMKGMYVSKITNWELVSMRVNKSQRPDGLRARDLKANACVIIFQSSGFGTDSCGVEGSKWVPH